MNFITIDFETATSQRSSPCEIGLTFVSNGQITETKSWLIQPIGNEYDGYNIHIHGISPEDTKDAPEFPELWQEIKPLVNGNFLIAHNAGFDMSVLRKTLELYQLPFPTFDYSCSYIFSKNLWSGLPDYGLKTLCKINGIELNHHRAGADSLATAELCLKAFEKAGVGSLDDFPVKLKTKIGKLFDGGYTASRNKYERILPLEIIGDVAKQNPDSIFYGKNVVFTGTLLSMVRTQAQQLIADIGGINEKGVTAKTDFLIVGQQDYKIVGDDGMSGKQEKAVKMIEKGATLEILSENDFLRNL